MKRNFKRIERSIILLGMLCFLIYSCKKQEAVFLQENKEDPITLDWYINYSWYNSEFGENLVSKKIIQDTGVNINFITPSGNEDESLNALISSDGLPDMITLGWWETQVDTMIEQKMVYALNELADRYDPYFWKVTDKQVVDWYTQSDGNLYCYPNSTYTPLDYQLHPDIASNQIFMVRKDIYEAIGSPDMTTPEGFETAIQTAATKFPEIDGVPMIPIGGYPFTDTGCVSFDQYLQNFLAIPYEKDGKFYDRYTDPEYLRWLKTFRRLAEKGYLKDDLFIDQRTQVEEKLAKGQYFCMIYQYTDITNQEMNLYQNNPDSIYIAIDGPKNSNGDAPVLPGAGINGWTVTLISKNCKNPRKAIQLCSYLMSEKGQKLTYLGEEGKTYQIINGKIAILPEVRTLLGENRTEYERIYGADNTYWMFQNNVLQLRWNWLKEEESPISKLEEWSVPYTHYLGQYEVRFDADTEAGNSKIRIDQLWSETLPKLLLAPSEDTFDQIMDEFIQKREKSGFSIVMSESTKQMKENKRRLEMNDEKHASR